MEERVEYALLEPHTRSTLTTMRVQEGEREGAVGNAFLLVS